MADGEDIQPLVCDNGTGMVKVRCSFSLFIHSSLKPVKGVVTEIPTYASPLCRLALLVMMRPEQCSLV
jgi:hypothetical protein